MYGRSGEEPAAWEVFPRDRTRQFPEPNYSLFAVPLGSYRIRACPGENACDGASETWTAAEPVEVRWHPRSQVELMPPEKP